MLPKAVLGGQFCHANGSGRRSSTFGVSLAITCRSSLTTRDGGGAATENQSVLCSSRYFASTSATCLRNCSSICRACGPAVRSSRSSASSRVRRLVKVAGLPGLDLEHLGQRDQSPEIFDWVLIVHDLPDVIATTRFEILLSFGQKGRG